MKKWISTSSRKPLWPFVPMPTLPVFVWGPPPRAGDARPAQVLTGSRLRTRRQKAAQDWCPDHHLPPSLWERLNALADGHQRTAPGLFYLLGRLLSLYKESSWSFALLLGDLRVMSHMMRTTTAA